jgi:hypothetical protein
MLKVLRVLYITLLAILFTFWTLEDIYGMSHCTYSGILLCSIWSWLVDLDYLFPVAFLLPWLFLLIYSFRKFRRHQPIHFEHYLIVGLLVAYIGFFVILLLSGYNG